MSEEKKFEIPALTREAVNELPLYRFEGSIHLVRSNQQLEDVMPALAQESVLGFDTETRPAFKKGQSYLPALVQLAGQEAVYLFQLNALSSFEPLQQIMADAQLTKVGVALRDDIKELQQKFPFEPAGFVELSTLANECSVEANGLRSLAAALFGFRISKRIKTSNWDAKKLSTAQVHYAATDAWVSREIYLKLKGLPKITV